MYSALPVCQLFSGHRMFAYHKRYSSFVRDPGLMRRHVQLDSHVIDVARRADQCMYDNKAHLKERKLIQTVRGRGYVIREE